VSLPRHTTPAGHPVNNTTPSSLEPTLHVPHTSSTHLASLAAVLVGIITDV